MSWAIDIDTVDCVMVGGQWFEVLDKSFDIDAYEYLQVWQNGPDRKDRLEFYSKARDRLSCSAVGFTTYVNDDRGQRKLHMVAPINMVQAVTTSEELRREKAEGLEQKHQKWLSRQLKAPMDEAVRTGDCDTARDVERARQKVARDAKKTKG